MTATTSDRRIVIDPVTRVEGHGRVTILLDEDNKVTQARLHIVEFRGFERFLQGRLLWEVPVLVQRLCGICPVSHHLAAAKAIDRIVGGENLTPTARKMRLLMHHGQFLQSHALHFFHLCSPDLLFGFDADVTTRNIIGVIGQHRDLAVQGVMMRKFGQEIIQATAGKKIHGTGAIPGGINKNLSMEERDGFLQQIDQMTVWARGVLDIARTYSVENLERLAVFGDFDSNYLSLTAADGSYEIYDGGLRARTADGETIVDHVDNSDYHKLLGEEVRSWTYMKFPFIKTLGPELGWYRVGPLARVNNAEHFTTPEAEQARQEFSALTDGRPCNLTMGYHWARMIELLHSVERIHELLEDPDLQGTDLVVKGERREEGVGIIEAPRGTLFHHYKVDEQDQVTMANLIVSTTSNNEPMNLSVQKVAQEHLSERSEITEGMLNHVEVAIRAYDPCLSCATHAMGQMPLTVELHDHEGTLIDKRSKA